MGVKRSTADQRDQSEGRKHGRCREDAARPAGQGNQNDETLDEESLERVMRDAPLWPGGAALAGHRNAGGNWSVARRVGDAAARVTDDREF